MKQLILVILSLQLTLFALQSRAEQVEKIDIIEILNSYSQRTGTKFVTDPRVKGKVRMIGIQLDELNQIDLNKILFLHAFAAYEQNGLVYVFPLNLEDKLGPQIGTKWE